jgi:hypothetical protein
MKSLFLPTMKHICTKSALVQFFIPPNNCSRMQKSFTLLFAFTVLIFSSFFSVAQSTPFQGQSFYVEASDLTVENYDMLYHHLKTDGRFTIDKACVPAHVMIIKTVNNSSVNLSQNISAFKALAVSSQINHVVILDNFTFEQFDQACMNARQ